MLNSTTRKRTASERLKTGYRETCFTYSRLGETRIKSHTSNGTESARRWYDPLRGYEYMTLKEIAEKYNGIESLMTLCGITDRYDRRHFRQVYRGVKALTASELVIIHNGTGLALTEIIQ